MGSFLAVTSGDAFRARVPSINTFISSQSLHFHDSPFESRLNLERDFIRYFYRGTRASQTKPEVSAFGKEH